MVNRLRDKRRVVRALGVICTGLFLLPLAVQAQEAINQFEAEIEVLPDSRIEVTETIEYDFGNEERHGIYRDIPVEYETQTGMRSVALSVQSVTRSGEDEPYELNYSGRNARIKIGDPDKTITGTHTYEISYTVRGALNYFEDFDELYWNVTGHEWDVPIGRAEVSVILPGNVTASDIQASCYAGVRGSSLSCHNLATSTSEVTASHGALASSEGVTIAVGFPKGVVTEPTQLEQAGWWLSDNYAVFFPLIALIGMFLLWYTRGRDPKGRGTIIARYEPPEGVKPIMAGVLIDEKIHNRDISAGLISLAEQGYVHITRTEEKKLLVFTDVDYTLELIEMPEAPSTIEDRLLRILFGESLEKGATVQISDLKGDKQVAKKLKALRKKIHALLVEHGYFAKNRMKTIGMYWAIAILFAWAVGILIGIFSDTFTPVTMISLVATALIIGGFGTLMPQKTKEGVIAQEHLKGFKEFLSVTQEERFKFHNAPERNPQQFMEYLPYAIAFNVEKEWAEQFSDIYIDPPEWYSGNMSGHLAATALADEMSSVSQGIGEGVSAASGNAGSGGGGAAGGGMGGGGGGSW